MHNPQRHSEMIAGTVYGMKTGAGLLLVPLLLLYGGCAPVGSGPPPYDAFAPTSGFLAVDAVGTTEEDLLLGLDPTNISARTVRNVLSRFSAPRVININGSIPIVTMDSFSRFLIGMGYPEASVRNPMTGAYSYTSYQSAEHLAGMVAWFYEQEGMMPIAIGHSGGGMVVIKVLHELAGAFRHRIAVRNPSKKEPDERYDIIDPLSGEKRPVVGLRLGFASAVATGHAMRILYGQWDMLGRLRIIPDAVEEFSGISIELDLLGMALFGHDRYRAVGSVLVRNVRLPASYSHLTVLLTEGLAENPAARAWIENYQPRSEPTELPDDLNGFTNNILVAAELWHSIKKHWCIALQRMIKAKRTARGAG